MTESILQEAERIINGDRAEQYGDARESFDSIARYWSEYLGQTLEAVDVASLMILLKVARTKNGYHRDSYVDIAGYAGLTERIGPKPQPGQWWSLTEVPRGVRVMGRDGTGPWERDDHFGLDYHGPFTELIDG